MQGNLGELDIRSILRLLESEGHTGVLYVESEILSELKSSQSAISLSRLQSDFDRETGSISNGVDNIKLVERDYDFLSTKQLKSWFVWLIDGKIAYACDSQELELVRIDDYLSCYQLDSDTNSSKLSVNTTTIPEYNYLIYLLQQQLITPQQTKNIIHKIIYETLFDLLGLLRGKFIFRADFALSPSLSEITISNAIQTIGSQLKVWQQLHPYVRSPEAHLLLKNRQLTDKIANSKAYQTLSNWAARQISLRRLSRQLNCYLVDLARSLYPYICQGLVTLDDIASDDNFFLQNRLRLKPYIVYVDNDVAIGKKVEYILKRRGYNLTIFTDSIRALTEILQIQPDLVFCKIDLPQLSGYELCNMLKNSWDCRQTKIILLSKQENFFAYTKAKVISSDDYLSLPLTPEELLVSIEKHLGSNLNNSPIGVEWSTEKSNN
jgi:twitching motility two-component system response regulator PilG